MNTRPLNTRILLVDDNPAIHEDFRKILTVNDTGASDLDQEAESLFGSPQATASAPTFELESAMQGEEALQRVQEALAKGQPFAAAFIDMRMPPGWDGLETIRRIWQVDPNVETVICTAFSDHSWEDIRRVLGNSDRLLILKKPFEKVEVQQISLALTEKWELRRQAQVKHQELEERVRHRTRELQQISQSKGEFLSNLSHELLTPLNGILGTADLLADHCHGAEETELITDLRRSGERLLGLLRDILTFNELNSEDRLAAPSLFDPRAVCDAALEAVRNAANLKSLQLTLTLASDLPDVLQGEPGALRQVLRLLLENAVKFTQKGSVRLTVRPSPTKEGRVEFSIQDTGNGLSEEQCEALRHPFLQLDGTTKRTQSGLGLSLTLARKLLSLLGGGDLDIVSRLGHGSIFRFDLPERLGDTTLQSKVENLAA